MAYLRLAHELGMGEYSDAIRHLIPMDSATPWGKDKRPLGDRRNGATRCLIDYYHNLQQHTSVFL